MKNKIFITEGHNTSLNWKSLKTLHKDKTYHIRNLQKGSELRLVYQDNDRQFRNEPNNTRTGLQSSKSNGVITFNILSLTSKTKRFYYLIILLNGSCVSISSRFKTLAKAPPKSAFKAPEVMFLLPQQWLGKPRPSVMTALQTPVDDQFATSFAAFTQQAALFYALANPQQAYVQQVQFQPQAAPQYFDDQFFELPVVATPQAPSASPQVPVASSSQVMFEQPVYAQVHNIGIGFTNTFSSQDLYANSDTAMADSAVMKFNADEVSQVQLQVANAVDDAFAPDNNGLNVQANDQADEYDSIWEFCKLLDNDADSTNQFTFSS